MIHIGLMDQTSQGLSVFSGGSRISHWGGTDPLGGANLQRVHFLAKTYVKVKEIDPVGGACTAAPPWICQWFLTVKGTDGSEV